MVSIILLPVQYLLFGELVLGEMLFVYTGSLAVTSGTDRFFPSLCLEFKLSGAPLLYERKLAQKPSD